MIKGMRDLGYIEGETVAFEWRYSDGNYERLSEFAAELARLKVDAIVVPGAPIARIVMAAAPGIPILFAGARDPVAEGFAATLARPGGNLTGVTSIGAETGPKRLELLLDLAPQTRRIGYLQNPASPISAGFLDAIAAFERERNVSVVHLKARSRIEIERAFDRIKPERIDSLLLHTENVIDDNSAVIAERAIAHRLPSVGGWLEYVEARGLAAYGASSAKQYYELASYVDRIARGARPGDLPIAQLAAQGVWINKRTADRIGLTLPSGVLVRAERVLE